MKIIYLCSDNGIPFYGQKGASVHARAIVRAFRDAGNEVVTVFSKVGVNIDHLEALDTETIALPTVRFCEGIEANCDKYMAWALNDVIRNVAIEKTVEELVFNERPDLIYERYSAFSVAGGFVSKILRIPHILEVNAPLAREGFTYRRQALPDVAKELEKCALSLSGHIVAVSKDLCEELVDNGADRSKISIIPNGVDIQLFTPKGPSYALGLNDDAFVIGFVGGLRPWHATGLLIDAFRVLCVDPRYHLLVVGDGPSVSELKILEKERPDRITWVRGVDHNEVPIYIRAMDVALAVYPKLDRFYFSPLKLYEYMAAGRAVIASKIGQISEVIHDEDTGLLIPPGDADALVAAIRRLSANIELQQRLCENAAREARFMHSWSKRVAQIFSILNCK